MTSVPNIRKVLDLSTAHIDPSYFDPSVEVPGATLDLDGCTIHEMTYGWLLWVPDDPRESAEAQADPPPDFILELQLYARGWGCDYILFDQDGDTNPVLLSWEW